LRRGKVPDVPGLSWKRVRVQTRALLRPIVMLCCKEGISCSACFHLS